MSLGYLAITRTLATPARRGRRRGGGAPAPAVRLHTGLSSSMTVSTMWIYLR